MSTPLRDVVGDQCRACRCKVDVVASFSSSATRLTIRSLMSMAYDLVVRFSILFSYKTPCTTCFTKIPTG